MYECVVLVVFIYSSRIRHTSCALVNGVQTCALPISPRTVTLFSQGINQSLRGTDQVNAIINVHLATGRIGKPGAAPFSITDQPNAMGGREVGGLASTLAAHRDFAPENVRSEEHTSELQSLMRTSYAVFCLKKKKNITKRNRC